MQQSVSAPLAKSYAGNRDWLDQGLQGKNLDPQQEFGGLTSKLQKQPQVRQAQRPPGAPPELGRGEKEFQKPSCFSPICSALGICSINLPWFLVTDGSLYKNQVHVHATQVFSSSRKAKHSSLHQYKRVHKRIPFEAPSKDNCRAHEHSVHLIVLSIFCRKALSGFCSFTKQKTPHSVMVLAEAALWRVQTCRVVCSVKQV